MLVRLLYASRALDTSPAAIEAILAQSRQYNPTCGITGILCYGGGIFLQAIEGGNQGLALEELVTVQQQAVGSLLGAVQAAGQGNQLFVVPFPQVAVAFRRQIGHVMEGPQAGGIGALGGQHPAQRVGVGLPIAVAGLGGQRAAEEQEEHQQQPAPADRRKWGRREHS